jgi:hypothetical protein
MGIPTKISDIFDSTSLPSLGPQTRKASLSIEKCEAKTTEALQNTDANESSAKLALSAALLWHDHLEESHSISQSIHSPDGSYLHAIMHRREPDYPNAKYWFHKVGNHPAYIQLTEQTQNLLANSTVSELVQGNWDPCAMVDAVSRAKNGTSEYELLQKVQQTELQILLERFCS